MNKTIKGKRVLLMVYPFFHYGQAIYSQLQRQGADVHLIYNRFEIESFRSSMNWVATLFNRIKNPFFKRKFTNQVIAQTKGRCYDYLIAIGGFTAQRRLIKRLRSDNPQLLTRIFFWDSFVYWRFGHMRKWFDKSFSFDPVDCARYKDLVYLPDFYLGQQSKVADPMYEVSHIGSAHLFARERIVILDKLKTELDALNISNFLMVFEPNQPNSLKIRVRSWSDYRWCQYRRIIKQYRLSSVMCNQRMEYAKVVEIETQSRCIIDIPSTKQAGITIRSLEALAAGKKLITTNVHIQQQAFYNPANIAILDPKNPHIDADFLSSESRPVDISYLRLDNWLKNLF